MVSVLAATLSGSHGKNWRLGDFSLQLIIHACMAMSVTDEYKEELAKTELIGLMITVIKKFLDGDKPIKAPDDSIAVVGGGGSDVVSILCIICSHSSTYAFIILISSNHVFSARCQRH